MQPQNVACYYVAIIAAPMPGKFLSSVSHGIEHSSCNTHLIRSNELAIKCKRMIWADWGNTMYCSRVNGLKIRQCSGLFMQAY